jgi:molybdate transport system substrate-binding protein
MKLSSRTCAAAVAALLALVSLTACGGGGTKKDTLTVFAAASLTESFTALGKEFEKKHPGVKVAFNFGPSSGLAEQIQQGGQVGVFASASPSNMDTVVQAGDAKDPKTFATNRMEIAVPPANPAKITGLKDLARKDVKVALCQAQVPCGKVAAEVFSKAKLTVKPATEEVDVKSVLTKVTLGEVDAGVVYVTDVQAAGSKVKGIEIPPAQNASTGYPIAALAHAKHASQAQEFVDLVLSSEGAKVLKGAGFQVP